MRSNFFGSRTTATTARQIAIPQGEAEMEQLVPPTRSMVKTMAGQGQGGAEVGLLADQSR